tara:strand:- start:1475 stop:1882 length:408 start_codon:yes stop_codon:yes gene_type:complete
VQSAKMTEENLTTKNMTGKKRKNPPLDHCEILHALLEVLRNESKPIVAELVASEQAEENACWLVPVEYMERCLALGEDKEVFLEPSWDERCARALAEHEREWEAECEAALKEHEREWEAECEAALKEEEDDDLYN